MGLFLFSPICVPRDGSPVDEIIAVRKGRVREKRDERFRGGADRNRATGEFREEGRDKKINLALQWSEGFK